MQALIRNIREEVVLRICTESISRISKCIDSLSDDQLTYNTNFNTNAVNNLILHLDGNVRQWLIASLMDKAYARDRSEEFNRSNVKSRKELCNILEALDEDVKIACERLSVSYLLATHSIQGFTETGYSICSHVVEHFSYHTGQITLITKQICDKDMNYYKGLDLNIQNKLQ